MAAPKASAVERLAKLLRKPVKDPEQRALQIQHCWIAKVGGVWGLDAFLEARDQLGLDKDLTDRERMWMNRVVLAVRTASIEVWDMRREKRPDPPSWEIRQQAINQREAERRKSADIYSHVPKPNLEAMTKTVETRERMAKAYRKLIEDILRDIRQAKGAP